MIIEEVKKELTGHIIPFWNKLRDDENGGFYGFMGYDLKLDKQADKGVILHARILWFYSKAYITLGDKTLLDNARHAYEFIKNHCIDYEYGGVYWMMNYKGEPADTMKHTYNIAFAIYALSCYYNASGDKEALELAYKLFHDIENNTLDEYGYREAFDRQWNLVSNDALSENGLHADKTMNAILHLIEKQKLVSEGAGATPVAAVMFNKIPDIKGKKVVCLVSGGNIDVTILSRVIKRGLLKSGRSDTLTIQLEDRPGQLRDVSEIISKLGGNVVSVHHERASEDSDITDCLLRLVLETRNFDQRDKTGSYSRRL